MARECDLTGKKKMFGGNRKHVRGSSGSGGAWAFKSQRTSRSWAPNLRKTRVRSTVTGEVETMKISMKAYKKLRTGESVNQYTLA